MPTKMRHTACERRVGMSRVSKHSRLARSIRHTAADNGQIGPTTNAKPGPAAGTKPPDPPLKDAVKALTLRQRGA
jgi:hypothetical protein